MPQTYGASCACSNIGLRQIGTAQEIESLMCIFIEAQNVYSVILMLLVYSSPFLGQIWHQEVVIKHVNTKLQCFTY